MDTTSNHTASNHTASNHTASSDTASQTGHVPTGGGEWGGQEFVRATVHLAGPVPIETGHTAHYTAEHVQARIGSALLYFLDYTAARDFATAVAAAATRATDARLFSAETGKGLPASVGHPGQDTSVIVRLRSRQQIAPPQAVAGRANPEGHPYLTCQLGGLVLVLHTGEALDRLVAVAETAHRVAAALWPQAARRVHDDGPDDGRDVHAEQWNRTHRTH